MTADDSGRAWRSLTHKGHLASPTPSADVHVEFGARSWHAPRRPSNDNHYLVLRLGRSQETLITSLADGAATRRFDEFAYGMAIADGLGRAGDAASRLAVSTLGELAVQFGKWNVRIDEPVAEEVLRRAQAFFKDVDLVLTRAPAEGGSYLETAMTAVYTAGSELFFAHVGHSRAYLFRDGTLLQLTHDHTFAERLGRAGSPPRIDTERVGLLDGDVVLLCTNGLSDVVDGRRIANVLREPGTPEEQCAALVNLAIRLHAIDNVTVVVGRYRIPE